MGDPPRSMVREYSIELRMHQDGMGELAIVRESGQPVLRLLCPQPVLPKAAAHAIEGWLSEVVRLLEERSNGGR